MQQTSPSVVSGMLLAGKYRVDRLIGEGGMGVVLAATNEALRQKVAIKLLRTGALANAKALGRFDREARAAASLRSEHVARVLDIGKLEDGRPYMVMEYLEGQDLGDLIDRGPTLPVGAIVDLVLQACEAVAEAHAAGIIHRDLKPKNLFLAATVDGRPLVKVLDFGISKVESAPEDMSLTRTTEVIGSPSYMSPEQLRASKEVDVRADIWSLGVILFELLTKQLPYLAATVTELVALILTEPVRDVRSLRPEVPEPLALAITRCLARDREARFASVSDLVQAIAPWGTGELASMADRVLRVAQGSSRSLQPGAATGSGPYAQLGTLPGANSTTAGRGPSAAALPAGAPAGAYASSPSGPPQALPNGPIPTSSARLAIHGGTSVAWGETQVDGGPGRQQGRARSLLLAGAAGLFLVLSMAGTGAFFYARRGHAARTAAVEPHAPIALPPGRKDLPPLAAPPATNATAAPAELPSTLPDTRGPMRDGDSVGGPRVAEPKTAEPKTAPKIAKAPTAPIAKPTAAPQAPATPPDDLNNIGRR
jgi:serine/threonine-protein kinase